MIQGVSLNDVIQLSKTETEKMVQIFSLKAADPAFDKTIRDGCLVGSPNGAAIGPAEELAESLGELAVTIMDPEPHVDPLWTTPSMQAGLTSKPLIFRRIFTSRVSCRLHNLGSELVSLDSTQEISVEWQQWMAEAPHHEVR